MESGSSMYSYKKEAKIGNERIRRLIGWSNGVKEPPAQIDAELHKRCNLSCLPCSRQASGSDLNTESKRNELPISVWMSAVKQSKELGVLIWNIEGACEPFANPALAFKVMKEIKKHKMYGIATTNGTTLSDTSVKKIVQIGWDRIHFSLDGHTDSLNDFIRGKGSYKKTVKAIKALNKYKKYYQIESPMLNINTVINNRNYTFLPELVELANSLNADFVFMEPLIAYHKKAEELKLDENQIHRLDEPIIKAKMLADKYKIDNNFASKDRNLQKELVAKTSLMNRIILDDVKDIKHPFLGAPCFKPWDTLAIKMDGLCGHCGLIKSGDSILEKSLGGIWSGELMQAVRHNMQKKELLPHCMNCCASDITQRRRFREELIKANGNS
jgi:MoaA/NifB/PqqE/SkfB family radical SAM enzyme